MSLLSHIHAITNRILDAKQNEYGELFTACDELYESLIQIAGIDPLEEKNRQNLLLETGHAIGVSWAALCIKDIMRTKRFMQGVYEAAKDVLQTTAVRPVHILYAGTGPFATLVLPLTARFSHQQIQFTFLEANEHSFRALQELLNKLTLDKYIRRIQNVDASQWSLPLNEPVDVFICETIQQGLRGEPQVAICMNIVPQLSSQAVMIPEQITLKVALMNMQKRMEDKFDLNSSGNSIIPMEAVFILNKTTILNHGSTCQLAEKSSYQFPATTITLPAKTVESHLVLCIITEIMVYKQEQLLMDESAITLPLRLADVSVHIPEELIFHYQTGQKPGLQWSGV